MLLRKVIVTFHGNIGRYSWLKNYIVRCSVCLSNIPITLNPKSFEDCKSINKKSRLIPAFIPPQKEEILPDEVMALLGKLHNEKKKIISTNAYNVSFDKYGNDTYGINFLVQYFDNAKDYALIVSDPSGNYSKQYQNTVLNSVFFIDYPHPYYELLKHIDVFVRNTSTDGDALSVKEALYLNVPTLCTDVVDRPEGVTLFKYCDKVSLERALNNPLRGYNTIENGADIIIELYKSIL